jgi:hypothetical protein
MPRIKITGEVGGLKQQEQDDKKMLEEAEAKLKKYSEEHKDSFDSIEGIFQKVDDTNIGILSTQKFNDALKSLKLNLTSRETLLFLIILLSYINSRLIIKAADTNNDGKIEYDEFLNYVRKIDPRIVLKVISLSYFDVYALARKSEEKGGRKEKSRIQKREKTRKTI